MELTDSGKFIEVEREDTDNNYIDKGTDNVDKSIDKTSTPNQSPGKSVRIKENGAKPNGDADTVNKCCFFFQ